MVCVHSSTVSSAQPFKCKSVDGAYSSSKSMTRQKCHSLLSVVLSSVIKGSKVTSETRVIKSPACILFSENRFLTAYADTETSWHALFCIFDTASITNQDFRKSPIFSSVALICFFLLAAGS